jgi:hypothetical protein
MASPRRTAHRSTPRDQSDDRATRTCLRPSGTYQLLPPSYGASISCESTGPTGEDHRRVAIAALYRRRTPFGGYALGAWGRCTLGLRAVERNALGNGSSWIFFDDPTHHLALRYREICGR